MKIMNNIKSIILLVILLMIMLSDGVVALSDTLVIGKSDVILNYIGETGFKLKKFNDGSIIYCLNHTAKAPVEKT